MTNTIGATHAKNDINHLTVTESLFTNTNGMDSREIARLTGKRHDNVIRDIEKYLGSTGVVRGGLLKLEERYVEGGREYKCYVLPKRECILLAGKYNTELTREPDKFERGYVDLNGIK